MLKKTLKCPKNFTRGVFLSNGHNSLTFPNFKIENEKMYYQDILYYAALAMSHSWDKTPGYQ